MAQWGGISLCICCVVWFPLLWILHNFQSWLLLCFTSFLSTWVVSLQEVSHPSGFCWENSVHIDSKMIIALQFVQKDLDATIFSCFTIKYLPPSTSRSQTVDQNIYPIKTVLIPEGNFSTSVCQSKSCQNPHWDSSCSHRRLSQCAEKHAECLF